MTQFYRIRDWDKHFENNKSRERDSCSWCGIPNKQDGLGYGRLLRKENGPALYGAFVAVVLVASKQKRPRDGLLTDTGRADGAPYTPEDLSIKTQIPTAIIKAMIEAVCDLTIGWIEVCENSARQVPVKCLSSALEGKGMESKEKNEKEGEQGASASSDSLSGMVKEIKACRPEFSRLRDSDIASEVHACPADIRRKTVDEFIRDAANMTEPPRNPIGLLRGYIRKAAPSGAPRENETMDEKRTRVYRELGVKA